MKEENWISTGLPGLDEILDGLRIGDNVVWKVDHIDDYIQFVKPYIESAKTNKKKIIYFRFADHKILLDDLEGIQLYNIDPRLGFESFASEIHHKIKEAGRGAFYLFDCLSDLLSSWSTDHMVGNFFRITCPYLFELDTIAYFALIRNSHAFKTITKIRNTTQLLLDIYNRNNKLYIHPLKVWQRNSPTMFLPHLKTDRDFVPLANSIDATSLLNHILRNDPEKIKRHLDHWDHLFLEAEDSIKRSVSEEKKLKMVGHLSKHLIGQEERILNLAEKYFSLEDMLKIKSHMIGTGFIGGKAVGMLLARNILLKDKSFDWETSLEEHDSFYIGSNLYYDYLVYNDLWMLFMEQKTPGGYFEAAKELKVRMLEGSFSPETIEEFQQILEYFGQYPFIIRSSSILEDSFGNAFAGKYDSYFCVNQGSPEIRLIQIEEAVKKIFASTMSQDALSYRRQRGLDKRNEQMALLIQRVSGFYRDHYYFPDLAGVGISHNTYIWNKDMDKKAGMLRLVTGLGTRAVDRVETDYPQIIALDSPLKRPHHNTKDMARYSQKDIDLLNISKNKLETISLNSLTKLKHQLPLDLYAERDFETMRRIEEKSGKREDVWIFTFQNLISNTEFCSTMQRMLKTVEKAYEYPVDIEFTVNFDSSGQMKINIVQCRPLQTRGDYDKKIKFPDSLRKENIIIKSNGNFLGSSISEAIDYIIYIDPKGYSLLPVPEKYELARTIGRINQQIHPGKKVMLMGPGRWGSSTPQLGIPISFSEINNMAVIAEMSFQSGGLIPEISYGSHFFHDLVETNIFYMALFLEKLDCYYQKNWFEKKENNSRQFLPHSNKFDSIMKIISADKNSFILMADIISGRLLFFEETAESTSHI